MFIGFCNYFYHSVCVFLFWGLVCIFFPFRTLDILFQTLLFCVILFHYQLYVLVHMTYIFFLYIFRDAEDRCHKQLFAVVRLGKSVELCPLCVKHSSASMYALNCPLVGHLSETWENCILGYLWNEIIYFIYVTQRQFKGNAL